MKLRWLIIPLIIVLLWVLIHRYPDALSSGNDKASLFYSITLLIFLGSSAVFHFRKHLSFAIKSILAWTIIIIVLVAGYSYRYELETVKNRVMGEFSPSEAIEGKHDEITIRRANDGHFYLNTRINDVPIRFMIDTGATDIVLSPKAARLVGFDTKQLTFNRPYNTANGVGWGASIVLDKIEVGSMMFHNVYASVNQADMDISLLGMSFLSRFDAYEVRQDRMILKRSASGK